MQDKSDIIRAVPLAAGALGISTVLANRLFSGVSSKQAKEKITREPLSPFKFELLNLTTRFFPSFQQIEPALLAASSQSRADVIAIFLSAVLCLTGLQWLSLKPKVPKSVVLEAEPINYFKENIPPAAIKDLEA